MIKIENSFLVDRPAASVYAVFDQVENIAHAFPTVREVKVIDRDRMDIAIVLKMGLMALDSNVSLEIAERNSPVRLIAKGVAIPGKGLASAARMVDNDGRTQLTMTLDIEPLGPESSRIRYCLLADAHGNLKRVYDAVIKGQRAKLEGGFIENVSKIMGAAVRAETGAATHSS
ncbi:MAG: hypothetical protein IT513_19305 [Burkholderiales bacterium]|nr:hypothetical protein [Burkholderiales bacterium]